MSEEWGNAVSESTMMKRAELADSIARERERIEEEHTRLEEARRENRRQLERIAEDLA